jgi:beta-lactam-binding protein with PASTA domain
MLGDSLRHRRPRRRRHRADPSGRPGRKFWLVGLAGALLVPFALGWVLTVFVFFPAREVAPVGIPVPSLYGLTVLEAERTLAQVGLGSATVVQLPHPVSPEGDVIAQSPLPGQQLRTGAGVRIAVSSGPVQVRVPDVLGQPTERAEDRLRRMGFAVARVDGESPLEIGRVFAVDPPAGTAARLPALVTLHVSLGPPPDSLLVDTMQPPPDTLGRNR